jgi:IS30 family transposase
VSSLEERAMAKLSQEARMTIKTLTAKGVSNRETARLLGLSEGAVRHQRRRLAAGAVDGRSLQRYVRDRYAAPPCRARRRVETPPGAQAQADWAHYPKV